jgi:hypothetical protein
MVRGAISVSIHGKISAKRFAQLANAGDDDAYKRRFPHWGLHHELCLCHA